jgi:hypothetical protein
MASEEQQNFQEENQNESQGERQAGADTLIRGKHPKGDGPEVGTALARRQAGSARTQRVREKTGAHPARRKVGTDAVIHYLIDASVAADFYRPRESFPKSTYIKHRQLKEHITKQRLSGDAMIFIPAFCIPEVFNTFAKWWYRRNSVFGSQRSYEGAWNLFASHVHDRKFFYSYDLTRYHNLNCHEVSLVEHKTDTEYQATGLPTTATQEELNRKLQEKDRADFVSRHYLNLCLSVLRRFWRYFRGGVVEGLLFLANLGMTNYCPMSGFFS